MPAVPSSCCWRLALVLLLATGGAGPAASAWPPEGAEQPNRPHWAFRTLKQPAVPAVRDRSRVRTPVDAFVLARLESGRLPFSPDADRRTLIRRASLDLLGLPPAPEEVQAFLQDHRPDAYERLIDRLLASPHFGERWGRHWLDGAGYVDVTGGDNDAATIKLGENKWRYRDYVLRAFNEDPAFDRFLTEQLAGDELVDWRSASTFTPDIKELLVATGFLRTAADDTDEKQLNTLDIRHGVLQRTGEVLANNLLGLTLNCAKCHDHKYEPISQRDYYRLLGLLQPAFNPQAWVQPKQRQLPDVSPAEKAAIDRHNADIDRRVADLRMRLAELRRPCEERLTEAKLRALPEPIRADTQAAVRTPPNRRTEVQKYLAGKFEAALKVKPEEVTVALNDRERTAATAVERQIAEVTGKRRGWQHLQVVYDVGPPTPTRLLKRGNHERPGEEVPPGFLAVLCESEVAATLGPTKAAGKTSGRRLALARWLTDVRSPAGALVLRVRVNRVWQHLFGKGLVETPDNFGLTGAAPTHPELLEWLAGEYAANGQRLKPLLRLLLLSTVYRQASARGDPGGQEARRIDPDNRLLWRARLRRLESEAMRDSLLAVGGNLDRSAGGPPIPVAARPDGTFVVPDTGLPTPTSQWRRSVYLLARRNYHPTFLGVFDQPNLTTYCTRRNSSAVVLQSLTLLHDRFVLEQADRLAERVAKRVSTPSAEGQVQAAFEIALSRPPQPEEKSWCVGLLHRQAARYQSAGLAADAASRKALAHLCHVLLNTSEFLHAP